MHKIIIMTIVLSKYDLQEKLQLQLQNTATMHIKLYKTEFKNISKLI